MAREPSIRAEIDISDFILLMLGVGLRIERALVHQRVRALALKLASRQFVLAFAHQGGLCANWLVAEFSAPDDLFCGSSTRYTTDLHRNVVAESHRR